MTTNIRKYSYAEHYCIRKVGIDQVRTTIPAVVRQSLEARSASHIQTYSQYFCHGTEKIAGAGGKSKQQPASSKGKGKSTRPGARAGGKNKQQEQKQKQGESARAPVTHI